MNPFEGRTVLVTGAGGSIGSELCRLAVAQRAQCLVMVSLTEAGLYTITRRLEQGRGDSPTAIVPLLGNCADPALMKQALAGVGIVVHAAAHKHVPICERNPVEAIANNVFGTLNMIDAADSAGVEQFCLISSDKAVHPASVMGATKRLAELLVASKRSLSTRYFTVRFGNVMDSAGSVLPLWREQIAAGGPITLTDGRCTRYFMTIAEAVSLVTATIGLRPDGGTFVLDMGAPISLQDLALRTIAKHAGGRAIDIQTIGLRPGEKLTEELHYGGDLQFSGISGVHRVVEPPCRVDAIKLNYLRTCIWERRATRARELLMELVAGKQPC